MSGAGHALSRLRRLASLARSYSPRSMRLFRTDARVRAYAQRRTLRRRAFRVDVCIVTHLLLKGGTASSTLEEVATFRAAGLSVLLVHCKAGAESRIAGRYLGVDELVVDARDVERIDAAVAIVRHPRVITSPAFERLSTRLHAEHTVFVVNNSHRSAHGSPVFDYERLLAIALRSTSPTRAVHPIGPVIRAELEQTAAVAHGLLSPVDWYPTMDGSALAFTPKATLGTPIVVGRHGRDGEEKWPQTAARIREAYPDDPRIVVRVLGGADVARRRLGGTLPSNWSVLPFGAEDPATYLRGLDVFVYIPHADLSEAFGRTIAEAMFVGVPCVLPPRFRETFGELAFYPEPGDVLPCVLRLAEDDRARLAFVTAVREIAVSRWESRSLFGRLPALRPRGAPAPPTPVLGPDELRYRAWVETGARP